MNKGLITELFAWTLFIVGAILIYNYADWQLFLGIVLFVSSSKVDTIYRIKNYIKDI